jgi:hypothetical protein
VVTVLRMSSNTSQVSRLQTLLPSVDTGLRVDSKDRAEQVRHDTQRRRILDPLVAHR